MKNFEANLDPMTFLIEQLGPTEAWRSAKSFSRIVNSCTKAGSVDEKRFGRLMRAGSKLNANLKIYAGTINFKYEWLSIMLVTFLEAYLEDGIMSVAARNPSVLHGEEKIDCRKLFETDCIDDLRIEAKREFARRMLRGGGPDILVERLKKLGACGYSGENIRRVQHLWDTRNLIIHSQGRASDPYIKKYPSHESGRVKIIPNQFKDWLEAVRDFMKPTDIFFLRYRSPKE